MIGRPPGCNRTDTRVPYTALYPDGYGAGTSIGDMASDAQARWQQAREALRTAVELQAQMVGQVAGDETTLSDLVDRSQSAVGALQVAQATHQLLARSAERRVGEECVSPCRYR